MEDRVAEAIGEWFERRDSTNPADPEELVGRYADVAAQLREHFRFLDRTGGLVRDPALAADVPTELGGCRIVRQIGEGGMGRVFLAEHPRCGPVAVKVLRPHLFHVPSFARRFQREADVGGQIDHPHVVRTLGVGAEEQRGGVHRFLVLELVTGGSLRDLIDSGRVPDEGRCRRIAADVAAALGAIHAAGAVHRDVKPDNVLLTADGCAKVTDLGVARLQREASRVSQTGDFVGSVDYGAPEQFSGAREIDHRVDLHALGVLLYELVTGVRPFGNGPPGAVIARILHERPRSPREHRPELSASFAATILRLLEKQPGSRFQSAEDVRAAVVI